MKAKARGSKPQRHRSESVPTKRKPTPRDFLAKAYALDRLGREKEAIPLYEAALRGRLTQRQRLDAMICLASSHRVVGNAGASLRWLRKCARAAPRDAVVRLFEALAWVDRGEAVRGLRVLAKALLDGIDLGRVPKYRRALIRYFRRAARTAAK